jgi:hypothetical protein
MSIRRILSLGSSTIGQSSIYSWRVAPLNGDRVSQTVDSVETTYIFDTATPLTMVLAETTS